MVKVIVFLSTFVFSMFSAHALLPNDFNEFETDVQNSIFSQEAKDVMIETRKKLLKEENKEAQLSLGLTTDLFSNESFLLIPDSFFRGLRNIFELRLRFSPSMDLLIDIDEEIYEKISKLLSDEYVPNLKVIDLRDSSYDESDILVWKLVEEKNLIVLLKERIEYHCCFHKYDASDQCPGCSKKRPHEECEDSGDDGEE